MIRVFIGFDAREHSAYHVLSHSILERASQPIAITPLVLSNMKDLMWRERHPLQSTDFSFSRFLTPYLSGYEGWSIFMDCDMLVVEDIASLFTLRDPSFAVQVVKHVHVPESATKFLGQAQTKYEKKNWSSVMLFNNAMCKTLTPDYVNNASGLDLHQFKWLKSDDLIGEIPKKWNHLVDVDEPTDEIANYHFTNGGPYFDDYRDCSFANLWFNEFADATSAGMDS